MRRCDLLSRYSCGWLRLRWYAPLRWDTQFVNIGLLYSFAPGSPGSTSAELLAQYLSGKSWMGGLLPEQPKVRFDFQAVYVLPSVPLGRHRFSFRYDWLETEDRDEFRELNDNDEYGFGLTFAYLLRTTEKQKLAFELIRVSSDRDGRAEIGLPPEAVEWLFQVSYRVGF